jgi:hypothetical protein
VVVVAADVVTGCVVALVPVDEVEVDAGLKPAA